MLNSVSEAILLHEFFTEGHASQNLKATRNSTEKQKRLAFMSLPRRGRLSTLSTSTAKKSCTCVICSSSCLCESLSLACGAISKGMVHPPNSTIHFLPSVGWSKKKVSSNVKSLFHPMYHKDLINVVVSNRLWVVAVQASLSQPLKMQGPLSPHRWCCSWCYPLAVKAHPVDLVKTWGWKPCCIWGWLL